MVTEHEGQIYLGHHAETMQENKFAGMIVKQLIEITKATRELLKTQPNWGAASLSLVKAPLHTNFNNNLLPDWRLHVIHSAIA